MKRHAQAFLAATALTLLGAPFAQAQTAPPVPPTSAPAPTAQPPAAAPMPPAAPAAPAEKPQRLPREKFGQVDANHDGAISREEAAAAPKLAGAFDEIDADRDGRVMPTELKAYAKAHRGGAQGKAGKPGKGFEGLDANHDGVLTRDEVAGNPKALKRFEAADADRDGRITAEEAQATRRR